MPLSVTFPRENLMFTEIKPSVNHVISLLSNLEKNLGEIESLFLSEVSPTGVFGEVQSEKIEGKETTKMIENLSSLLEKLL